MPPGGGGADMEDRGVSRGAWATVFFFFFFEVTPAEVLVTP